MSVTTVDFWVKSFDNTYLKCAKDVVNSPKATILILHGLAEHYKRYDYVTNKFVEKHLKAGTKYRVGIIDEKYLNSLLNYEAK